MLINTGNIGSIGLNSATLGWGRLLSEPITLGNKRFMLIPNPPISDNKDYLWTSRNLFGERAYRFEGRPGDNFGSAGDSEKIRCGADGFISEFDNASTKLNDIIFWVYPEEGTIHDGSGQFWHAFELHAKMKAEDVVETSGPLRISTQWSASASTTRLRVIRQFLNQDPTQSGSSFTENMLYDTGAYLEKRKYRFRVRFREHEVYGQLKIWLSIDDEPETQIVNYYGQFGYNGRKLYPQFRSYGATKPKIVTTYGGFDFQEYDLPIVLDEGFVDPTSVTLTGGGIGATAISGGRLNVDATGGGASSVSVVITPKLTTSNGLLASGNYRASYQIISRSSGSISLAVGPNANLYSGSTQQSAQSSSGTKTFDFTVPDGASWYFGFTGRGTSTVPVTLVIDNLNVEKI